jgi:hypothetical protein
MQLHVAVSVMAASEHAALVLAASRNNGYCSAAKL